MIIKVKKLYSDAQLPQTMRPGDAAMDFYAYKDYELKPGQRVVVETGVAIAIPLGYWGNVRDRSGLPAKHGIHTMGGVFDAGYRGEYNTHLVNLSDKPYTIETGDKVSQLIIYPVEIAELEESDELSDTSRGEGRFGSTGKK